MKYGKEKKELEKEHTRTIERMASSQRSALSEAEARAAADRARAAEAAEVLAEEVKDYEVKRTHS